MKQQPFTPYRAALGTRLAPPPRSSAPRPSGPVPEVQHRLQLSAGQGQLLWLDAGCELRCLAGVAVLRGPLVTRASAMRLPAHAAWRSPNGLWLGIEAEAATGAVLQMTQATSAAPQPWHATGAHEKGRPGHTALQQLGDALRKWFLKPTGPTG